MLEELKPILEKFDRCEKKDGYYDLETSVMLNRTFYLKMIDNDLHIYNVKWCSGACGLTTTNEALKIENYVKELEEETT